MKKLLVVLMISFLLIGIGSARNENTSVSDGEDEAEFYSNKITTTGNQGENINSSFESEANENESEEKFGNEHGQMSSESEETESEGNFGNEYGQTVRLSGEEGKVKLQVGNYSVNCEDCNLTQEMVQNRTVIKAKLSNGRDAEIKVMPDRASETALNQLRIKNCDENCTIQLREVGNGNETKLAYALNATKEAKIFGLFKTKANVEAQIDAETGEVIASKKPWWLFISSIEE